MYRREAIWSIWRFTRRPFLAILGQIGFALPFREILKILRFFEALGAEKGRRKGVRKIAKNYNTKAFLHIFLGFFRFAKKHAYRGHFFAIF